MSHLPKTRTHARLEEGFGPLEWMVLEVLWQEHRCSVRDVLDKLPDRRAYTTVMTTLHRLFTKGVVKRTMSDGRFLYAPRLDRAQIDVMLTQRVISSIRKIQENSQTPALIISLVLRGLWEQDPRQCEWLVKLMSVRQQPGKKHGALVSNRRRAQSRRRN